MTNPTADPAANTVFDQSTFSAVNGETVGGKGCNGTDSDDWPLKFIAGGGAFNVNVPMNEWMSFVGESAAVLAFIYVQPVEESQWEYLPYISASSRIISPSANFWHSGTAIRSFQSVSPSSWSVRMKHVPEASEVHRRTMSAGTRWFFSRCIRSPTRRDDEGTERVLACA